MSNNKSSEAVPPESPPDPVDVSPTTYASVKQELDVTKSALVAAQHNEGKLGEALFDRDREIDRLRKELADGIAYTKSVNSELNAFEREMQSVKSKHKNEVAALEAKVQEAFTGSQVQGAAMFNIKKQIAIHEHAAVIHDRNSIAIERLTGKIK